MVWSNDRPTRPGYYWFRGNANGRFLEQVVRVSGGRVMMVSVQYSVVLDSLVGTWAGPIEIPVDQST